MPLTTRQEDWRVSNLCQFALTLNLVYVDVELYSHLKELVSCKFDLNQVENGLLNKSVCH